MKPPNNKTTNIVRLPAIVDATAVRKREAINRNIDIDVRCIVKSRRNWRKNLLEPKEQEKTKHNELKSKFLKRKFERGNRRTHQLDHIDDQINPSEEHTLQM